MTAAPHNPLPGAAWRTHAHAVAAASERWPAFAAPFEKAVVHTLTSGRGLPRSGQPTDRQLAILRHLVERLTLLERLRAGRSA
jgi:hypothetical protein